MRGTIRIVAAAIALATAWHSAAQSPEKFEVASVRISTPGGTGMTSWSPMGGAAFTATNISLRVLVSMAYAVDDKQILGDDLLGTEQYDVSAKPAGGGRLTYERLKPMLVSLLSERFKLVTHRETKTFPGYALVAAKGGPKLHASDASTGQSSILPGRIIGHAMDMGVLASLLARPLGTPVLNKTGIEGTWDIDLKFAPEGSADSSRPSIFTAVQEQLGLKLESQKVLMEMLVVDRCERVPTEN